MSQLNIPFNLSILELDDKVLQFIKPVRVLDTFEGSTKNFHDDGLFSQVIFGKIGDQARNKRLSYIDLKVSIFHPLIYRALLELKSLYGEIISGKTYAIWDKEAKDFVKSDMTQGETGMTFFIKYFKQINYPTEGSEKRKSNSQLIQKYLNKALTSKIVVLPAGLRDYEILDDGRESEDEFNKLYRSILATSIPIHQSMLTEENVKALDGIRYTLQLRFNEIYDKLESMLKGKHRLILGKWAKRGIFNGTRNVITTTNIRTNDLNSSGNVSVNDTVMGLYQYLKAVLPVAKYQIRNGFLSQVFPGPNSPAVLVNKKTLKPEMVNVKPSHFDAWMSDEGLDNTITQYGEKALRGKALEIEGYWMGLIYKGKGQFKLFQDIDELPAHLDKKEVYPVTFTELLYIAVYENSREYPCLVTRYPITGYGSIYPSYVYLKPTIVSEVRVPLDENWQPMPDKTAYTFPSGENYVNALSPASNKLAGLGADGC